MDSEGMRPDARLLLLDGAIHDLNNLLLQVGLAADVLADAVVDADSRTLIDDLRSGSRRGERILRRVREQLAREATETVALDPALLARAWANSAMSRLEDPVRIRVCACADTPDVTARPTFVVEALWAMLRGLRPRSRGGTPEAYRVDVRSDGDGAVRIVLRGSAPLDEVAEPTDPARLLPRALRAPLDAEEARLTWSHERDQRVLVLILPAASGAGIGTSESEDREAMLSSTS